MQNPYPPSRVLISKYIPTTFAVSDTDTYIDIFTPAERNAIVNKYRTPNLFDGDCIRLDKIVNGCAYLSPVTFFDFLCCNIVGIHNRDIMAWPKLNNHLAKYGRLDTFEKVLSVNELPNIIGTSTLLHDVNNEYLLVERNTKVSVGSGLFACTSSGSLCLEDMNSINPIIGCGLRELREEMNLQVNLQLEGICMPIQKMQPIALLTGKVDYPWTQLLQTIITAEDFKKENNRILLVPKNDLLKMISLYSFTDAASFHIFFEAGGNQLKWQNAKDQFLNIKEYYVF